MSDWEYIQGAEGIYRKMRALGPTLERRITRRAVRAGAQVFVRAARRKVSKLKLNTEAKRRLRRSIRAGSRKATRKRNWIVAGLYLRSFPKPRTMNRKLGKRVIRYTSHENDPAFWGRLIQSGTADRYRGKKSRAASIARKLTGSQKGYTGRIKQQPYLQEAFDENVGEAQQVVIQKMIEGINKEMEKK